MARFTENRWTSAIIPALLIHIPIGTVYCWSVFKQLIADRLNASPASVEWGFSLAIFFLGMSAAFAGPMRRTSRNPHSSPWSASWSASPARA